MSNSENTGQQVELKCDPLKFMIEKQELRNRIINEKLKGTNGIVIGEKLWFLGEEYRNGG